jgi:hypothetical protein
MRGLDDLQGARGLTRFWMHRSEAAMVPASDCGLKPFVLFKKYPFEITALRGNRWYSSGLPAIIHAAFKLHSSVCDITEEFPNTIWIEALNDS